jgi:hypothetical protein
LEKHIASTFRVEYYSNMELLILLSSSSSLTYSHNRLNRWKNYFYQLLNVHSVSEVRQIEIHTAEPLVPGPSSLEVEIAIAKLEKYKPPGSDQIPAELIQSGGETLVSVFHKLINSILIKEEMPDQW